ncbi:MAG: carboxypeptidase regulatory-like domain-containing protein, partial [Acidobacteriaceae bacterium]
MKNLLSRFALFAALALPVSLAAATISGTVTDKTTGKPAAGDTAVLLDLQQGMTESAHTTIDAKGHYSFTVPDTNGMHLVRVDHQKASYYGPVPPNTTIVNVDVFDVAPKVDGIHLYADVERMETDQQGLSVTESYFVRNESKPPKTQLSAHSFEVVLPSDATLEGATAAGPGGMAVESSPVPTGEKGHYAFIFPLRPGETRFQLGYHLPYNGSASLHAQVSMPADNVAVMLPKAMTFSGQGFQPLQGDASGPGTQTFLATNVKPDTPIAFTVSGTGSMPREQQQAQGQGAPGQGMGSPDQSGAGQSAPSGQSAMPTTPGGGLGNPIDTPDPLQKYKWWILSGVGLA